MTTKDALTSNNLAGAIPEDFVGAVNKNAAKADDELETVPFNGRDVRLQPGNKRSEDVVANRANFAAGDKLLLSPRSGYGLTDAVVEKVGKSNLQFRGWRNTVPILKLSGGLRIRGNMVSVIKGLSSNAKFAPGDVAYCRTFACNARVMSVGTTKSGICNYKVALYDAKGVRTGEAVCSESDLVRRSVRGLKVTGLVNGASRACDVAATILEKMVARNKVDLPLAKKMLRLTQRDFPDARVSVAAAKLNENPPALLSAAKILRAEANRLRAQGKSMKAMRAAVKRAPAEALPMIAPLHSKLLMIYRKFIGSPETASLGSLPALAAQWKAVGNKLPHEEQSGVDLIVRDLISAYRSFTKEQMKNVAYFLAMALGTANKMVGGSANVPIPAHLRAVKGEVTRKVVLNNARKRFLDNYKFKVADAEYEKPNPAWQGGKRLPTLLSAADVTSKVNEYIFANSGARYGKLIAMDMNAYASFITKIAANQGSALGIHHLFGDKPGGFANADTIVRIGANAWNEYSTKFNASIQNKPAN